MKRKREKMIALLLVVVFVCLGCGCGKLYTCYKCDKKIMEAYYDPFHSDRFFCSDCAREYFAPFPYKNYSVE